MLPPAAAPFDTFAAAIPFHHLCYLVLVLSGPCWRCWVSALLVLDWASFTFMSVVSVHILSALKCRQNADIIIHHAYRHKSKKCPRLYPANLCVIQTINVSSIILFCIIEVNWYG